MHYVLVVLMAILGAMFPGFLVKAIKSTDKNEADGALFWCTSYSGNVNAYRWYVPRCMVMRFYYKVSNMF